ncbi:MAG TPA: histidinol dehydrogenase [Gemmatimonadaceae bacterium]|nr:histidinol dehydrogenase [Gemmatimonadaceae bacterium]
MSTPLLRRVPPCDAVARDRADLDEGTLAAATAIVSEVRRGGVPALLACAERYDARRGDTAWLFERVDLRRALDSLDASTRGVLERAAARIAAYARAQRATLTDLTVAIPNGRAGHRVLPMERAGCYAPGGRYPLPSSLLMTAVTARVAGVDDVVVATPSPSPTMLAAAAIADADVVIGVGGAHAIAALAYGVGVPACDIVVGPGNRWVTAAKRLVAGDVAIDMLAGPSELLIVADASAEAATVAADLIAQAEHDPEAFVALVTTEEALVPAVERELSLQLATLPTASVSRASLRRGLAVVCEDLDEAARVCDVLAPEHLQLSMTDAARFADRCRHAGACFLGERSAEVFGDYGVGGNHVLPTGRRARYTGGLSVLSFLRVRSWLELDDVADTDDIAALARIEGLEGHARAAERRAG